MTKLFYCELNAFCILIIATLFVRVHKNVDKQNSQRLLEMFMLSTIGLSVFDMLWILLDHALDMELIWLNYVADIAYYILSLFVSFFWFLYSETLQESKLVENKRNIFLCAIPMLLAILLNVTTPWTHLIFSFDEDGNFTRGVLNLFQRIIPIGYIIATSGKAFLRSRNRKNYANKNKYLTISSFCVYPFIFSIWQMYITETPVLTMGITLAILQVYINLQNQLISIDPLTQLNNRNQMIRFLSGKMRNTNPYKTLYLLIMDMDYFKKINDQYGHIEGDRALIRVANTLKKVCAKYNCFVCRYGGDEFIMVGEFSNEEILKRLCIELNEVLAEDNTAADAPYVLHLSIGYAAFSHSMQGIPDFIEEADKMLYEVKRARKQ